MLRFISGLKFLMSLFGIKNTKGIEKFLDVNVNGIQRVRILKRLRAASFKDGFFRENLAHCACSTHQLDCSIFPVINSESLKSEENFCFHDVLLPVLGNLYLELVDFAKTQVDLQEGKC